MFVVTIVISGILVIAALVQFSFACWFRIHFPKRPLIAFDVQAHTDPPRAAVIICVRGCDPSLEQCLKGILAQDYLNYEIHLVVDSQNDMGWEPIRRLMESETKVKLHVHLLEDISRSCSLKCNAILLGLEHVSKEAEYLLLLDADVTPHERWISELIGPLAKNPQIGMVCGAQWFEPPKNSTWGALVRSTWNGGAMVPTIVFNNPWAGSLALRMEDVRRGKIPEIWAKSIVDDGPLSRWLESLQLKPHFAPSLVMVNRENCTFRYAHQWMTRMLLWSRLHESNYWLSVIHSVFSTITMTLLFAVLFVSLWGQQWANASIAAGALIVSGILSVAAYMVVRQTVRISRQYQGRQLPNISLMRLFKLFWAVPLTQWIYLVASLRALKLTKIVWRDVTYQVKSKDQVQILEYQSLGQEKANKGMSI